MARLPKPWYRKDRDSWFVTINGTRHNLGPDKKAAFEQFYDLMSRPKEVAVKPDAFVVVADRFLEWVSNNRSPDTYEWYRYRVERFCRQWPDLVAKEIRPYHIQQWVDGYPDLSQTSQRNYVRSVKRCVKWAAQQGYIHNDPVVNMEVPGAESKDICITPEQFQEFCGFLRDESILELVKVTFECGCRPQEILRVEARHFEAKHGRWILPPREAKGKKRPRIVYLSPYGLEVTIKLCDRYPTGKLFRNSKGRAWTTDAVNCAFLRTRVRMGQAAIDSSGLKLDELIQEKLNAEGQGVQFAKLNQVQRRKLRNEVASSYAMKYSLYALRHSWSTRALQSGVDALTVATLMGHSDTSTLARVYSHINSNPEHMKQQAQKALGETS